MDIALMVVVLFMLAILLTWGYTYLVDPKEIDQEEKEQVRAETAEERERSRFKEIELEQEQKELDKQLFSND
jgi:hypothetical protein